MKNLQHEIVIPIAHPLIDQLAEQVAEKVMARLSQQREIVWEQPVRPAPAEVSWSSESLLPCLHGN